MTDRGADPTPRRSDISVTSSDGSQQSTDWQDEPIGDFPLFEEVFEDVLPSLQQSLQAKILSKAKDARSKFEQKIKLKKRMRKIMTGDKNRSIKEYINTDPEGVRFVDKLSFTLGVLCICWTQYILFKYPSFFLYYYTILMPILLLLRIQMYRKSQEIYFLFDFCYFSHCSILTGAWVFPASRPLFIANFLFANGPVGWAIVTWRNSLVFHSLDKVSSVYLHLASALLLYCWQWYGLHPTGPMEVTLSELHLDTIFLYPFLLYLSWQILFLIKTEYLDAVYIAEHPELQFSLRYFCANQKTGFGGFAVNYIKKTGLLAKDEMLQAEQWKSKFIFMGSQLLYTFITVCLAVVTFHSQLINACFLSFIFTVSVWNGASFYIMVFAKRYLEEIQQRTLVSEQMRAREDLLYSSGAGKGKDEEAVQGVTKELRERSPSSGKKVQ